AVSISVCSDLERERSFGNLQGEVTRSRGNVLARDRLLIGFHEREIDIARRLRLIEVHVESHGTLALTDNKRAARRGYLSGSTRGDSHCPEVVLPGWERRDDHRTLSLAPVDCLLTYGEIRIEPGLVRPVNRHPFGPVCRGEPGLDEIVT